MKFLKVKYKAQAMYFALLVSAIVGLFLSSFVALTHTNSFFRTKASRNISVVDSLNFRFFNSLETEINIVTDTLTEQTDFLKIKNHTSYNGVWLKSFYKAYWDNLSFSKSAYLGVGNQLKTPNLYLKDATSPLILVGDTRIEGLCYLPKRGVKSGIIAGNYYQYNELIYGRVLKSKEQLPQLNKTWLAYIEESLKTPTKNLPEIVALETNMKQSFNAPQKIIYENGSIMLSNHAIHGNYIIKSNTKITVTSQAQLTDVILVAPVIEISQGFEGVIQAIAEKNIEVGENCKLNYPSALVLDYAEKYTLETSKKKEPKLIINKGSVIEGCIVYLKPKLENSKIRATSTDVILDENSNVVGQVYCEGNLELEGEVKGSVFTSMFVANQYGSVYINHIYGGRIVKNNIANFSGLPFQNEKQTIAKWLY